jgi:hypothetical protein
MGKLTLATDEAGGLSLADGVDGRLAPPSE